MNLHGLVRSSINFVNQDETILLYRSNGNQNISGIVTPLYLDPISVKAQVQSVSDAILKHIDRVNDNSIMRNFYLFSEPLPQAAGIVRTLAKGGDMIQRPDLTWWLVDAVPEDFTPAGWVLVRATQQKKGVL